MADKGNHVDVIHFDFCKAFDLVQHDSLIKKSVLYSINKAHVKWIKNWLADRSEKGTISGESLQNGKSFKVALCCGGRIDPRSSSRIDR